MFASTFMRILPLLIVAAADQPAEAGNQSDPAITLHKLCDAAWVPRPERFDILLYRERKLRQMSRDEIHKMAKEATDAIYPEGTLSGSERDQLVKLNANNITKAQAAPRRIIQRIRRDGERQRVDMVILKPNQAASDARLSYRYITLGSGSDPKGRNGLEVAGELRTANILPDGMQFAGTPVAQWISVPFKLLMQLRFGAAGESGRVSLSEERLQSFLTGASGEALRVTPVNDSRYSSDPLDRVEILDAATGQVSVAILCDRDHYGHAYEFTVYDPATDRPRVILKRGGYLPQGVATELQSSTYDDSGSLVEADKVFFLRCDFNPVFGSGDFELRAPPGYGLVDARKTPSEVVSLRDPSAAEDGDTIRDLLATRSDSLVTKNLARVGIPIPGSERRPKPK